MSAHGSPRSARRSGTVSTVNSSGITSNSSSHSIGVDTWAPTLARTPQAPNTFLCGAFWLKSTNTLPSRNSFHHWSVIRSGCSRARSRATVTEAPRTAKLS